MGDVWNEVDNDEFGKVMAGKQIVRKEATLADPIFQSKERFVIADSKKKRDNCSLPESAANKNHPLPNQLMLPPK